MNMPQPMRPSSKPGKAGAVITHGPNIILQRPELAAQIGNIIANWTLVETGLLDLYALMMGDYLNVPEPEPGWVKTPANHPVASQVFEKIQSFNARLDLVEALFKWRATPEENEQFSLKLKKQIRAAYKSRNSIAHDGWAVSKSYPDALLLTRIYGHPQIYKLQDFEQISKAICDAYTDLGSLSHAMFKRRMIALQG
ncbi:hypothetical protein AB6B38_07095 [Glycocaulis abyssi]|uniref:Apea-like HEPN domain-containing protein n=1 Tax=Glycocaulis abyssi TaxID=1433403 RepID=A0ABV9NAV9_9PROT